jgi:hypothetical protein
VLRVRLLGANTEPAVEGADEQPGKTHYFIGADPSRWRTNVPTYAQVTYHNVYPGIDQVYYGNQRRLEFDFVVAPGADPTAILLSFDGADSLQINAAGDLVLQVQGGEVRLRKPVVYQPDPISRGAAARRLIDGQYVVRGQNHIAFEIAEYDKSQALIIDPVLDYSTYLGGSNRDAATAIAVDRTGNAYVAGTTRSADFPVLNPAQTFQGGTCGALPCRDVFVTKLNPQGSALVYSTFIGGTNDDVANDLTLDRFLNVYITGHTLSSNFATTRGAFQTRYGGAGALFNTGDAFVTKLDAAGAALVYSTYLGGSGDENAYRVVVDNPGNAYIPGFTTSANFPSTVRAYKRVCPNSPCYSGYVTKLGPQGNRLQYSTFLGGTVGGQLNSATGLALDAAGNTYVAGITSNPDFPTTARAYKRSCGSDGTCNGTTDAFVSKLNAAGSALVYSTFLGGSGFDNAYAIQVDSARAAYVTGSTVSTDFPVSAGAAQRVYGGGSGCTTYNCGDVFVTKLQPSGAALLYSTYLGGSGDDGAFTGAVDGGGRFHVVGQTSSADFPMVNALQSDYGGGTTDAFAATVNAAGSEFDFSTYLGGNQGDSAGLNGVALGDSAGDIIYVAGATLSPDLPITPGAFQEQCGTDGQCNSGNLDGFVSKIIVRTVYDAYEDFSLSNNPNGPWTYGWGGPLGGFGRPFTLVDTETDPKLQLWTSCVPFTDCFVALGLLEGYSGLYMRPGCPPGTGCLVPVLSSVLRFTVPHTGVYTLRGYFERLESSRFPTYVRILINNFEVFQSGFSQSTPPVVPFEWTGTLPRGYHIEFSVATLPARGIIPVATGLSATIEVQ